MNSWRKSQQKSQQNRSKKKSFQTKKKAIEEAFSTTSHCRSKQRRSKRQKRSRQQTQRTRQKRQWTNQQRAQIETTIQTEIQIHAEIQIQTQSHEAIENRASMNREMQKSCLCFSSWHEICERTCQSHCEKKQKLSCHDWVEESSCLKKNVDKWTISRCEKVWKWKKLWRKMKSLRFYL